MRLWVRLLCLWVLVASGAGAAEPVTLKFATLAPEGSTWLIALQDWADQVAKESEGRLAVRLYPGGVSGDEPVMLRKIRFGQLHGAALSGHGIGMIHPPTRVLEMPLMFRDYDEIDVVRRALEPEFRKGFRFRGFELLGLTEVGFVRYFSQVPIRGFKDLEGRHIWLWEGDPLAQALFAVSGISPIPLSITEVYSGLSTGLIDTVNAPPLAAIALQWFAKTPYMTELRLANSIGALVVSDRFVSRLSDDLQDLLRRTGADVARRISRETERDNAESLVALRANGIETVDWNPDELGQLLNLRDQAAERLAEEGYIPEALYRRVAAMLANYRDTQGAETAGSGLP